MINLQLEVHEVEALLKHIENSAKALLEKIHAQSMPQVIAATAGGQAGSVETPAVPSGATE